jgi:hypothetical protein
MLLYVPEAVFAATIKLPSTSTLKAVRWCYITISCCNEYPFKVSFDVTFCTVTGVVADAIVVGPSFTASIGFKTTTSSIITICWAYIQSC